MRCKVSLCVLLPSHLPACSVYTSTSPLYCLTCTVLPHMHRTASHTLTCPMRTASSQELKLERPDDSLNARLEKMYVKVLKSLQEEAPGMKAGRSMTMGRRDKRGLYNNSLSISE